MREKKDWNCKEEEVKDTYDDDDGKERWRDACL